MCFFKPKLPKIQMPQVTGVLPGLKESTSPEPQAAIFGGGVDELAKEVGKKGVSGLKVPTLEKAAGIGSATGAMSGFNVVR